MRGVEVIHQGIAHGQASGRGATLRGKRQPRVVTVDALVHLEWLERQGTVRLLRAQDEMLCHISGEAGFGGAQFAPGDFAVVIRVGSNSQLGVANRHFQRATQTPALHLDDQESATGDMCGSHFGQHQQQEQDDETFHRVLAR